MSARDRVLGKLARSIALVLAGKHKPPGLHDQSQDAGDYVVVTNARNVVVTGKKEEQIVYRHHTMYPGGLKEIKYQTMMATKPEEVSGAEVCREEGMAYGQAGAETLCQGGVEARPEDGSFGRPGTCRGGWWRRIRDGLRLQSLAFSFVHVVIAI